MNYFGIERPRTIKRLSIKPKSGEHWRIFHQSYEEMQSGPIKGLPLLSKHKIDTQADIEVKLDKPIEIKAGEELGLMGEYNQIGESGEKLLHLEVFTYDNIEQFKAKAEAAYKQDKEKKGIKRITFCMWQEAVSFTAC